MSTIKTQRNNSSVNDYIHAISDPKRREDIISIVEIMKEITLAEPVMWGASIIGFGSYHYKYASGREGDWFLTGVSSRKQSISIYTTCTDDDWANVPELGRFKTGKSCLYIKQLSDIDVSVLKSIISSSIKKITQ